MLARLKVHLLVLAALLYVASWPGGALRAATVAELVAPQVPESIHGRDGVLDVIVTEKDGGPIAGARVRAFAILDGRAHAAGEARADADGRATLKELPSAEHWVVAEAPGRARASQMVVVVAGARRLDLALAPEHTLDVQVEDDRGAPMPLAELEVRGPDPFPVGGRTDADGKAHVGRLGEGPYTVVVRAPGFEEVTKRRVPERETLRVVLGRQGALVVDVVGEDGAAVGKARVLLASAGTTRVAETGPAGSVRIAGLDRGSYALRATLGTRVSPIELGLVVEKGEEKTVTLTLGPGQMVTAHVVDGATDDDVRDAKVSLVEGGLSPFPLEGVTDKRGVVVLGPIARGTATLSARAEGFVPRAVAVGDGPEVRVPLVRGGTLVGKITDARGYAVDGATIRVVGTDLEGMPIDEDPSRASFREAMFDAKLAGPSPLISAGELGVMPGPVPAIPHGPSFGATRAPGPASSSEGWISGRDGMFRATPVTPGRVRALVHHPQYVEAMSEVVLVTSEKETRVDVVLQRGGTLEGHVTDARGRGVSGAHVTALATRGSSEHTTRTGTDGSFAFASLPELVTVLVARDEDPTTVLARLEIAVPDAGTKNVTIALPEPRPALRVTVNGPRGGLEAAQVSATSLDPTEMLRATVFTDERGRAEVPSGTGIPLRLEVRAPGHASTIVTTTPEQVDVAVTLAPAESLTGEVVTRRRDAIPNAEVTVQTESGVRRTRTSKDGTFTLGDVTAGTATLRVRAPGFAPAERALTIADRGGRRATEAPRVELAEEAVLEGVVVDGRGDPVPGARVAKDAVPTWVPALGATSGTVTTDGRGRFRLGELAEGAVVLEAYAADVGRGRKADVRAIAGRTLDAGKIVIAREATTKEPMATGGVAITLGETPAGLDLPAVVVVAVAEGSEAERAGLAPNDVMLEVGGAPVASVSEARAKLAGPVHDDVVVKVRRGDATRTLRIAREAVRR